MCIQMQYEGSRNVALGITICISLQHHTTVLGLAFMVCVGLTLAGGLSCIVEERLYEAQW